MIACLPSKTQTRVVHGRVVEPSDLQYLTDENIEEIGGTMTHVEKMRMQAALQALRGTKQRLHSLELDRPDWNRCAQLRPEQNEAGTE